MLRFTIFTVGLTSRLVSGLLFVVGAALVSRPAHAEFQIATEESSLEDGGVELEEESDEEEESDTSLLIDPDLEGATQDKKKAPKPNFGPYRTGFERICKLVRADGRQDYFYTFLVDRAVPDEECLFCEKYFRAFASACKPKKPGRNAKKHSPGGHGTDQPADQGTASDEPAVAEVAGGEDQLATAAAITPAEHGAPAAHDAAGEHGTPGGQAPPAGHAAGQPSVLKSGIPKQREPSPELLALTYGVYEQLAADRRLEEVHQAVDSLVQELQNADDQTPGARDYFAQLTMYMLLPFSEYRASLAKEQEHASGAEEVLHVDQLFSE